MTSINVAINIIEEGQPLPIQASVENASVESRDIYSEELVKEYTTCENVAFYPVEILREEDR